MTDYDPDLGRLSDEEMQHPPSPGDPRFEEYERHKANEIAYHRQRAEEARIANEAWMTEAWARLGVEPLPIAEQRAMLGLEPAPSRDLVWLSAVTPAPPRALLIDRLDDEGHTILYGPGDTGKGVLTAFWIVELALSGRVVAILDYEYHRDEWARRIDALGGPEARAKVVHVNPPTRGSIWDHAAGLAADLSDAGVGYVFIDSIVTACRGADPLSPATAAMYAGAIEALPARACSLAHVTRAHDLRYPFGTVFWHNLARTTWSLSRAAGEGHSVVLRHRKHNNHRSAGRFLYTVEWWEDLPREVRVQAYQVALADRCAEILGDGPMTLAQIVEALGDDDDDGAEPVKATSVRKALGRGIPERFRLDGGRYSNA